MVIQSVCTEPVLVELCYSLLLTRFTHQQLLDGLGDAPHVGFDTDEPMVSVELNLKGTLTEVQEFWMSELCWKVIDSELDSAEEDYSSEDAANRVLDLIGIK
jgi:hypothetical protein